MIGIANAKGSIRSLEFKENLSKLKMGKTKSEETKSKMKEACKLRPLIKCPHCGKIGTANSIKRYHFNKCKLFLI